MRGDAEQAAPNDGPLLDLEVPGVGAVRARRPLPRAVHTVASAVDTQAEPLDRHRQQMVFVCDHLGDGEYERLLELMMDGDAPADAMELVARALATWGTERPYLAVVNLAFTAAFHWRAVRTRLRNNGIHDPMALPHMHMLLDEAESAVVEQLPSVKDKGYQPKPGQMSREEFHDRLYKPEPSAAPDGKPSGVKKPPAWWNEAESGTNFNGFAQSIRGG